MVLMWRLAVIASMSSGPETASSRMVRRMCNLQEEERRRRRRRLRS
jgi:hypothetical protein